MTRNITVYLERDQKKVYFENVDINTLGELKALLTENNINYADMDFNEGVSGVKLLGNESQLPHDLTFKGQRTNDLMILLTTTAKKTASGADRRELYEKIKKYSLLNTIKDKYRVNFTNLPTAELEVVVHQYEDSLPQPCAQVPSNLELAFLELLSVLYESDLIEDEEYDSILNTYHGTAEHSEPEKGYTQSDIDEALKFTE